MGWKKQLILISMISILVAASEAQNIEAFHKYFAVCQSISTQQSYIAIRKFSSQDTVCYLVVNPADLTTFILDESQLNVNNDSWDDICLRFGNTAYVKALQESSQNADAIQDAGLTHFSAIEKGANLTVDLCPSNKPLDRELFINLIDVFTGEEKPVPVALSVTGIWMNKHQSDLEWLKVLVHNKEVSITWINHSYNHKTSRDLPLRENFLLEKGTDLNYEVLQTEIKMIENGIVPSVFFRFPGLVSDKEIFKEIIGFGLIPIGSDAWLGKNQWPKDGSVILLHGNGNEPIGLERFNKLVEDEKNNIRKKQWLLYDLRESVENFENAHHNTN